MRAAMGAGTAGRSATAFDSNVVADAAAPPDTILEPPCASGALPVRAGLAAAMVAVAGALEVASRRCASFPARAACCLAATAACAAADVCCCDPVLPEVVSLTEALPVAEGSVPAASGGRDCGVTAVVAVCAVCVDKAARGPAAVLAVAALAAREDTTAPAAPAAERRASAAPLATVMLSLSCAAVLASGPICSAMPDSRAVSTWESMAYIVQTGTGVETHIIRVGTCQQQSFLGWVYVLGMTLHGSHHMHQACA